MKIYYEVIDGLSKLRIDLTVSTKISKRPINKILGIGIVVFK